MTDHRDNVHGNSVKSTDGPASVDVYSVVSDIAPGVVGERGGQTEASKLIIALAKLDSVALVRVSIFTEREGTRRLENASEFCRL